MLEDYRTPSEHDTDRILYSDELRRLGGVTQVVAAGEMPLFHTRLTHTLKVQQLARRIAEHIGRDQNQSTVVATLGGLDVGAAEAAGLAHDLGHPPFGHVGEAVLHKKCRDAGLDGFEGNAQTFRVLTKLSRHGRTTEFGLGISDVTLRGVIKYPWMRTGEHEDDSKWNAYATETAEFERARSSLPAGSRSIEASIMDWADDVTYAVHDLEDFIRAGRVPMQALASGENELALFVERALPRLQNKWKSLDWDAATGSFASVVEMQFAQFAIHRGQAENVAILRSISRMLINQYISAISVVAEPEPIQVPDSIRGEVELFKQLTWHYIIHDPSLATLQLGQEELISGLFDRLTDWVRTAEPGGDQYRMPRRLRDFLELTSQEPGAQFYSNKDARRARAVADYIASLTERQAENLFDRLRGTGQYSALDPWLAY